MECPTCRNAKIKSSETYGNPKRANLFRLQSTFPHLVYSTCSRRACVGAATWVRAGAFVSAAMWVRAGALASAQLHVLGLELARMRQRSVKLARHGHLLMCGHIRPSRVSTVLRASPEAIKRRTHAGSIDRRHAWRML